MNTFRFPESFSLGVASAATQIDGDCKNSSWYDWYLRGHIKDSSNPDIATRHRDFLREDTALMASMGIRDYRLGLEWARIEPEDGVFSQEEFCRIREELTLLRESGIRVLVTLHHFSNPLWFEKRGGFLCADYLKIFLRFVTRTVRELGGLANEYITINEPNVYATGGYYGGGFPPGKNSISATLKVINRLGACHRRAYEAIHALRRELGYSDTRVGFAHHMRAFAPYNPKNPLHRVCAAISKSLFQGHINNYYIRGGRFADFLAVNYYTRTASRGFADGCFPGVAHNDLGWEIYPAGIVECCRELHEKAPSLPIYITENGTADNCDSFRTRYIYEHLRALCESGLPVVRYYHWCFVDNFEWLEGFGARFGLVFLDTSTMERKIKKSGEFFAGIIREGGIGEEAATLALGEKYNTEKL